MLKIGLIGVGHLGIHHLKHLVSLEGVAVSGVWDVDPAARNRAETEFNTRLARSLEELLELSDAVDLVTPTSTHFAIGMQVLAAGKPLFVEKPICAKSEEALRLVERAEERGLPLQVGHIERFNRAFRGLKSLQIRPRFIEAHRLSTWNPRGIDVAVVHDLMIHDLDLTLALADREPTGIAASGVSMISDTADIANARIEFGSELVANITASRISLKNMRKLRIFAHNSYLSLDLGAGTGEHIGVVTRREELPADADLVSEFEVSDIKRGFFRRALHAPAGDALRMELESFRDAVTLGTKPPVSGNDGLRALRLAERIVAIIEG